MWPCGAVLDAGAVLLRMVLVVMVAVTDASRGLAPNQRFLAGWAGAKKSVSSCVTCLASS
jgi:hypothetical protein